LAAPFDVRWPVLHGLAGLLGVPILPIAAILISFSLGREPAWAPARKWLLGAAILTWISLALMVAAMCTLRGSSASVQVPIGWPNRLLVAIYVLWTMSVAWQAIRLRREMGEAPPRAETRKRRRRPGRYSAAVKSNANRIRRVDVFSRTVVGMAGACSFYSYKAGDRPPPAKRSELNHRSQSA
jgi:hypothetical protein